MADLDLAAVRVRYDLVRGLPANATDHAIAVRASLSCADVPALVAKVERLRKEVGWQTGRSGPDVARQVARG